MSVVVALAVDSLIKVVVVGDFVLVGGALLVGATAQCLLQGHQGPADPAADPFAGETGRPAMNAPGLKWTSERPLVVVPSGKKQSGKLSGFLT